jgi:putative colanic acid biosynthesis acetyltransferase WcaF
MRAQELSVDIAVNRSARKYRVAEQLWRVLWSFGRWAFRLSPRPLFGWRRFVLRLFGASVGRQVHIYASARIYMPWHLEIGDWGSIGEEALIYNLGRVRIGRRATVSYRAHVCAGSHDFTDSALPLIKPPVVIEDDVWIGTEAFIGPGVTVGYGALVGARAVVVKDVPALQVVAGNPARQIGDRPATAGRGFK